MRRFQNPYMESLLPSEKYGFIVTLKNHIPLEHLRTVCVGASNKGVPALVGYCKQDRVDGVSCLVLEVNASDQVSQKTPREDEHQHVGSLKAAIANRCCPGLV